MVADGDSLAEPLVGCDPDHPPLAVQLVAFVALHVRVDVPPLETLVGLAARVTDGAGGGEAVTVMVADACPVPPAPLQLRVYVVVADGDSLAEPLVGCDPDHPPLAVQLVAFVALHVRVDAPPLETLVGLAVRVTEGAGGGGGGGDDPPGSELPPPPHAASTEAQEARSSRRTDDIEPTPNSD